MKYQVRENKKEIKNTDVVGEYKDIKVVDSMIEYYSNNVKEDQEFKYNRTKYFNFIKKHLMSFIFLIIVLLFVGVNLRVFFYSISC